MRIMLSFCALVIAFVEVVVVHGQVDVSAGTYSCYPCGRQKCGFAYGGSKRVIDPAAEGFGADSARPIPKLTCQQIQQAADNRELDPEMCSFYSSVTRGPDDPCECQQRDYAFMESSNGKPCIDPHQSSECMLCGRNKPNAVIGDPYKVLDDPMFPVECGDLYDTQRENIMSGGGGYSGPMCSRLQVLFARHCQCVDPSELHTVTTCVPQEDIHGRVCNKDKDCCAGSCRYIHQWRTHGKVCTYRPDESHLMPAGWTNPTVPPLAQAPPLQQAPPLMQAPPAQGGYGAYGCFSGATVVNTMTETGNTKWVPLEQTNIGDVIEVSSGKFEPIYAFGHYQPNVEGSFVKLGLEHQTELEISKDHLIWTPTNGAVAAGELKVGQSVVLTEGTTTITSIDIVTSKGIYAPFTPSGSLIVNHGLMVSSYISMSSHLTWVRFFVPNRWHHTMAHVMTLPHRFACLYHGKCTSPSYNKDGINVVEMSLLYWGQRLLLLVVAVAMGAVVRRRQRCNGKI
mmetsp:Transcript_10803/g.16591  ORF Transcript_10803/g.16591 Transcript_10803/m.16591 type:complete len:511 (+) Transcript_10803:224-1756(+)